MRDRPTAFGPHDALSELQRITDWWLRHAPDREHGGFVGEIDARGNTVPGADKGIILNARLLWFFAEVAHTQGNDRCREAGQRAYDYLVRYFDDPVHGGAVWQVSADGKMLDGRKQIYALCFCIYGFCAWFAASGDRGALERALAYVELIEEHARDSQGGGYLEAFSQDWTTRIASPLGPAGADVPKTMNTHLHLLEAYTAVYAVAPDARSERRLRDAIDLMRSRILDRDTRHLGLYFADDWQSLGELVSFGHDIEASWLLWEAGHALGDDALLEALRPDVLALAGACLDEGLGANGQLCNEYDPTTGHMADEAIWWVQAEALVGFLNAGIVSGEDRFREACDSVWAFVAHYQVDLVAGDWHWFSTLHTPAVNPPYLAGFWKGPYHNGRAMLECLKLFERLGAA